MISLDQQPLFLSLRRMMCHSYNMYNKDCSELHLFDRKSITPMRKPNVIIRFKPSYNVGFVSCSAILMM